MPLDGLSFSNSGLFKIITPTEVAFQAEQAAQVQAETSIKKPEGNEKIKPDIEEDNEEQNKDLEGRSDSESDENQDNDQNEKQEKIKKYKVRFNPITDMVELVDRKTNTVIETISPDDLVNLISKTMKPSGILVDKEI
jgi:chromatin remodeling complex protein RSC6